MTKSSDESSFELTFNTATALLDIGKTSVAEVKIKDAMDLCRKFHEKEGYSEEEVGFVSIYFILENKCLHHIHNLDFG